MLLAAIRLGLGHELPDEVARSVADADWDACTALGRTHFVLPLAFHNLHAAGLLHLLPESVAAQWRLDYDRGLARATRAHAILAAALRALAEAGITPICLKGPALAEQCYPHPATRPMSDLDLLVRADERHRAEQALRGAGFASDVTGEHFAPDEPRGTPLQVGIELHTDLLTGRFGNRKVAGLRAAELRQRARPARVADSDCLSLDPADTVVFLGAHMTVHHGLLVLIWLADLAYLAHARGAQLGWDAVVDRATRYGVQRAVGWPLRLARDLFVAAIPAETLVRLGASGPVPHTLRRFLAPAALFEPRSRPLGDVDVVARSLFLDRPGDRLRYFVEIARGARAREGPTALLSLAWRFARSAVRLL